MKPATTLMTKEAGLDFWDVRDTFFFSKEPIKALGPTQPPINGHRSLSARDLKLTTNSI
jgi:hypothetical protein